MQLAFKMLLLLLDLTGQRFVKQLNASWGYDKLR